MNLKLRTPNLTFILLFVLVLTDLTIIFDVPELKPLMGFFLLTFLPGFLILRLLKLNKLETAETFVLIIGISLSFVMLFGLILNYSLYALGYIEPLSTPNLLLSFNLAFILLMIIAYKTTKDSQCCFDINLSIKEKLFLVIPVTFPALSVLGMDLMNRESNNFIIITLIVLIALYVCVISFYNKKFPERLYPIILYLISISLLLLLALRSYHLIGSDIHTEYYLFKTTLIYRHWGILLNSTLDSCLSISILPTIFQAFMNIDPELLFKIFYSAIYSITPLIVYIISKRYVSNFHAFLASCFFMFQNIFISTAENPRTVTALLFFALAVMALFNNNINRLTKRALFIVFITACIISHYATTYIFFLILLSTYILGELVSLRYKFVKQISGGIILIFLALIVFWYAQIISTPFHDGIRFVKTTFLSLNEFFLQESHSQTAETVFGQSIQEKTIPFQIDFVLRWITFLFIGIGFLTTAYKYKSMSFPEMNLEKPDYLKNKFDTTYFLMAFTSIVLLVVSVALPFVAQGYGLDRMYPLILIISSVFFVIGGIVISKKLYNIPAYLIILMIMIPYFVCMTGLIYDLFDYPYPIILNSKGEEYDYLYVHDQETYAAKWLKNYTPLNSEIFADFYGDRRLISQGMIINPIYVRDLIQNNESIDYGYLYLRYAAVVNNKLMDENYIWHNISDYSYSLSMKDDVYSNGGSEVLT